MCDTCTAIAVDLALTEAEADVLEILLADGTATPGARTPTPEEIHAGVKFDRLRTITDTAATTVEAAAADVREGTLDALAHRLIDALAIDSPWDALAELTRVVDPAGPPLPGVGPVIATAEHTIRGALTRAVAESAAEAVAEARRQGVPAHLLPDPAGAARDPGNRAAIDAHAARAARAPVIRLAKVAADAAAATAAGPDVTGPDVIGAAIDAAEQASTAGTDDVAHQAANVAAGLGRTHVQREFPPVRAAYASELLDKATCGPCAAVDGRTYDALADALVDYPGAGGYIGCDGGARCRGTLVLIHDTEAAPTLPGEGPGGAPPDTTPRGPSGLTWPAHIDDHGRVIPVPPDDGWDPPDDAPDDAPDDYLDGVTAEPVALSPDDVATGLDPAWADTSDDDLAASLASAEEDESDEALEYAALVRAELERRAAAGVKVAAPVIDTTAGEAATQAAVRSAVAPRPAGRLRERVAADWDAYLFAEAERVEAATNGFMVRADRLEEFRRRYGSFSELLTGRADAAYYYASEELRRYWEERPRLTRAEFEVQSGITDAKTVARAARAREARLEAAARAEEDPDKRRAAQRAAAAERRRARGTSEGEKLRRAQDRAARYRAQTEGGPP